jgi:hypothetical protein
MPVPGLFVGGRNVKAAATYAGLLISEKLSHAAEKKILNLQGMCHLAQGGERDGKEKTEANRSA